MKKKSFKALQREWYAKLARSGFVDIEHGGQLKVSESLKWTSPSNNRDALDMATKAEFYRLANEFLTTWGNIFMSDTEQVIWEKYCDGMGCRAIAAHLATMGIHTNKDYVHWAIRDFKSVMMVMMNVA